MNKPRTFEHFPSDDICPVCKTNADTECILIKIDGTRKGNLCESIPVHLWCAIATNYNKEMDVLYIKGGSKTASCK